MRLVTASEIREIDRLTIENIGIPGIVLMENASRGAARVFLEHFKPAPGSGVLVICGKGNNGGDGFAVARHLSLNGLKVVVILLANASKISGDALKNLEIIRRIDKIEIIESPTVAELKDSLGHIERCGYIIDAIFGTGLNSDVQGVYREAIQAINSSGKQVMSVDIPSGLNSDNGRIMGITVRSDLTVTFGFPKTGQVIFPGAGIVGRLACVDIGIPGAVADTVASKYCMSGPDTFTHLFKEEKPDSHKGARGHLLILAGSTGKTGATAMTALGALRAGAGLVTLGVPSSLNSILEVKLTEAMTVPLSETAQGTLSIKARDEILRLIKGKSAIAIGPGLSTNPETAALVRDIVTECDLPMVIDADGLNALAEETAILERLDSRKILTPHPGEMSRLTDTKTSDIQLDRIGVAAGFVERYKCCLVLKGARTIISGSPDRLYINPTGGPALSSGGSGDVLTGIISGLLSRGMPAIESATAGVYIHGMAGDLLAEEMGESGVIAGDLPDVIPCLIQSLKNGEWPLKKKKPVVEYRGLMG
ncbi:MAG: NAD(P)H-hydrate dehydratase [Deltaproteobacteria bacterium]|nr:NAD(P)H-hydrate dehydratase [Deltaproteobacteria bacterium]